MVIGFQVSMGDFLCVGLCCLLVRCLCWGLLLMGFGLCWCCCCSEVRVGYGLIDWFVGVCLATAFPLVYCWWFDCCVELLCCFGLCALRECGFKIGFRRSGWLVIQFVVWIQVGWGGFVVVFAFGLGWFGYGLLGLSVWL